MHTRGSRIAGMGAYLPERVVTNDDLAKYLDTSDEWIVQRSGIRERRYTAPGESSATMGAEATRRAVADAGWKLSDIEFIIFATLSPKRFFPGAGCDMQALLGLPGIGALDIRNQCSGFPYGLTVADALIAAGRYRRIVLVGAEAHSPVTGTPQSPRDTAVLFGDAAAAVLLEASDAPGLLGSVLHADGRHADSLKVDLFDFSRTPYITHEDLDAGRQFPVMDGRQVFRHAVDGMVESCREVLAQAGKTIADVDLVIPHQANLRISEALRTRLDLPEEKVFNNIQTRGNTTAASIPLAMVEARDAKILKPGHLVLMPAFGAGFTWGAVLWQY
jgi:3-oxoacyl-[acyl-carrier-protein] synthase-3